MGNYSLDFKESEATLERLLEKGAPLGEKDIIIDRNEKHKTPQIDISYLKNGKYKILLNCEKNDSLRGLYQFSHELCHIYCDPLHTNLFIESICCLSSIYFIYFKNKNYYEKTLELYKYNGDFDINCFRKEIPILELKFYENLQHFVAYKLLPIFEKNDKSWLILPYIKKYSKGSFRSDLYETKEEKISSFDLFAMKDGVSPEIKITVEEIIKTLSQASS